jgi:hypothetical protein
MQAGELVGSIGEVAAEDGQENHQSEWRKSPKQITRKGKHNFSLLAVHSENHTPILIDNSDKPRGRFDDQMHSLPHS